MRVNDFRQHWREQQNLAHTPGLPGLDDEELVKRILPLASIADVPSEGAQNGIIQREAVLQRRSDAYLTIRYRQVLEDESGQRSIDGFRAKGQLHSDPIDPDEGSTEFWLAKRVNKFWTNCKIDRGLFRDGLEEIVQNRTDARKQLKGYLSSARKDLLIIPKFTWPDSRPVELKYIPLGDKGVFGYVLMVLLDNDDVYERLRQCRYRKCRDFYITEDFTKKGPKHGYCIDKQCRSLERRKRNAEAQARFRANRQEKSGFPTSQPKPKRSNI